MILTLLSVIEGIVAGGLVLTVEGLVIFWLNDIKERLNHRKYGKVT